ncbi:MAG: Uma2 family endonuclease [Acidobacteria bacterium]|nr:Uma2 family endonuclease [Acidobacteriota bacterium]
MTRVIDDGIVVVEGNDPMDDIAMTTDEYLSTAETTERSELRFGLAVREPAAPYFTHQQLVLRVARLLSAHVEPRGLGEVAIAPVDVILDRERALVVQPDVLFVSSGRLSIIREQVWGAPDLVVEVLSQRTREHDRGEKLGWYRQYGVRECWLVDVYADGVTVVDFTGPFPEERGAHGSEPIRSKVLPDLISPAFALFHK